MRKLSNARRKSQAKRRKRAAKREAKRLAAFRKQLYEMTGIMDPAEAVEELERLQLRDQLLRRQS
jgi:hypothetical protein